MTTGVSHPLFTRTIRPAAAVAQFRAVKADGSAQCNAQDELISGVTQMSIDAGTQGTVVEDGDVQWEAAAAIAAEAAVTTDNVGRCITSGVGEKEQGRTKEAANIAGHVITVKLGKHGAPLAP